MGLVLLALAAVSLTGCMHPVQPRPSAVSIVPSANAPGRPVTIPDEIRQYLNKPGFRWKCNQTPHFLLCYQPGSESEHSIKDLEIIAEQDRDTVLQMIGVAGYGPRIYTFFVKLAPPTRDASSASMAMAAPARCSTPCSM